MNDIEFTFAESSQVSVKPKCFVAILVSSECPAGAGESWENINKKTFNSIDEVVADGFNTESNTYKMLNIWFSNKKTPIVVVKKASGAGSTYVSTLDNLVLNWDWFGFILIDSFAKADILAVAAWAESHSKIFSALVTDTTDSYNGATFTDITSTLKALKYAYTMTTITTPTIEEEGGKEIETTDNFLNVAAVNDIITTQPGARSVCDKGNDWKAVQSEDYRNDIKKILEDKCINHYYIERNRGVEENNYQYGTMVNGDSLFQRRNIMWLKDEVNTRLWNYKMTKNVIIRSKQMVAEIQNVLVNLFLEAVNNNVCLSGNEATKALFASKMGVLEDNVQGYDPNGYILIMPDPMDNSNWESLGGGRFKYKNVVFDVIINGVITHLGGEISLRKN